MSGHAFIAANLQDFPQKIPVEVSMNSPTGAFPEAALLMGVLCVANVPRDRGAIVLGIVPFVVTEILFTLSE